MEEIEAGCTVHTGFSDEERAAAGALYFGAFGAKLTHAFADRATGQAVVTESLRSDRLLTARLGGRVVGACGFYDDGGGAIDATWSILRSRLPRTQSLRAALVLSVLRRRDVPDTLVLDGLCVDADMRGRGVGSLLLDAAVHRARAQGTSSIQLSVIDSNPRAARLYRRHGFRAVGHARLGPLRHLFGFDGYTTMRKDVAP